MPDASYLQSSFLGGEWSPYAQGRMDDAGYRTGMNVCRNTIPVEEGAATRRPGTRLAAATRSGAAAVLRNFDFERQHPYSLEITAGHMRFFSGPALLYDEDFERPVLAVSAATPAVVETPPHGLATGDQVFFKLDTDATTAAGVNPLLGLEFVATVLSTTTFSLTDALTGAAVVGASISLNAANALLVEKIVETTVPYTADDLQAINTVQDQQNLLLLHRSYKPYILQSTAPETDTTFAQFSFGAADLLDGPYYDPVADAATVTASGTSGSVTLTIAGGTTRWATTDVGRHVRLFSEPVDWDAVTAWTTGQQVKYNGAYYAAARANTNKSPETNPLDWGVDTAAAAWTWAQITAYTSATIVTATIRGEDLLRTSPAIATWRLGLFSDTTGWPDCGVYHENRLWLSGVIGNRIDGSKTGDLLNFAPTDAEGTVADDNACQYVFAATEVNKVFWMLSDKTGIVCGTQGGEWIVKSSQQDDPLTPTSVQARRVTQEGCADIQAVRMGLAIGFVQRWKKTVNEFLTTDVRGYSARNLSASGKHLTGKTGVEELAYQAELAPILWARTTAGELIGCTYSRSSPFASDPPDFAGWHRHDLGNAYEVVSIQTGPSFTGDVDALSLVAKNPDTGYHYVYVLTDIFDENNEIEEAYFVDQGVGPAFTEIVNVAGTNYLRFYGLWRLEGETVAIFVGGVDAGDYLVTNGYASVPLDTDTVPLLTTSWLSSLNTTTNFRGFGVSILLTPAGTASAFTVDAIKAVPLTTVLPIASYTVGAGAIDWDRNRLYYQNIVSGWVGWEWTAAGVFTQIINVATPVSSSIGPVADGDGNLYMAGLATNVALLQRVPTPSMVLTTTFGVAAAQFNTDATHFAVPGCWTTIRTPGGRDFMVSSASIINEVSVMDLDFAADDVTPGISWTGLTFAGDEGGKSIVCRGISRGALAFAYAVNGPTGPNNRPLGIYRISVNDAGVASYSKIGTLSVPSMFTDWKHYDGYYAVVGDETPGSEGLLIFMKYTDTPAYNALTVYGQYAVVAAGGHDWGSLQAGNVGHTPSTSPTFWQDLGVTHAALSSGGSEQKIIKVSIPSLAVQWRNRVFGYPSTSTFMVNQSRVRNGHFVWWGSEQFAANVRGVLDINTVTGVAVRRDLYPVVGVEEQAYDDTTGRFYAVTKWNGTDAGPPLGTTSPVTLGATASWGATYNITVLGHATGAFWPGAPDIDAATYLNVPVAIGFTYTSQGQILRPISPQESGAANGPALGKTRRTHMTGILMHKAQGVEIGTVFNSTRPALFRQPNGTDYALTSLFSGIYQATLEDDYSFDSMVCWEITRPYPATMLAIGPNLQTQDR